MWFCSWIWVFGKLCVAGVWSLCKRTGEPLGVSASLSWFECSCSGEVDLLCVELASRDEKCGTNTCPVGLEINQLQCHQGHQKAFRTGSSVVPWLGKRAAVWQIAGCYFLPVLRWHKPACPARGVPPASGWQEWFGSLHHEWHWRTVLGEKCPSQLEVFPQLTGFAKRGRREGKEAPGLLLAAAQVGAGLECWGCCSITDLLLPLPRVPSHQTEQQSPQLRDPTAQTLLIPAQSLWSCSCDNQGVFVVGDCWRQGAHFGTELSEITVQTGLLWAHQWLLLKHRGTWQLPGGGTRTGRTKESKQRPLAKLALECPCSQLLWLQGPAAPAGEGCPAVLGLPRALWIAGPSEVW